MDFRKESVLSIGIGFFTIILFYPVLSQYLFAPNSHMYSFGGDALTIYYNIQYHVCYGSGVTLNSMNHPNGELIFLTDAQGALAMILQWINNYIEICDYVIGIINFLNAFSVVIAAIFIYFILRVLQIDQIIAFIFSPLLILLSPQIFRLGGHFGLAYLFLIPMVYLYILTKDKIKQSLILDLLILSVLLFFVFNNPYMGFVGCSLVMLASIYFLLVKRDYSYVKLFSVGMLPLLIGFLYFKFNDPYNDRIKIQWGYFSYPSTPKGLIAPSGTIMADLFSLFDIKYSIDFESINYLGTTSFVVLFFSLIFVIYRKYHNFSIRINQKYYSIIFASLLLYLYSTGLFFLPFGNDFVEDNLGFLLMFKAVARLGWPIYFTITIFVIYLINELFKKSPLSIGLPIVVLLAIIWNWDINTYVKPYYKDKLHNNFLGKEQQNVLLEKLKNNNIDPKDYQAILSLPKIMTWTDNFISEVNWSAQYNSMNLSRSTGLPLLNAMLSRMSIGQTAERIELLANPLIDKSLPKNLKDQRDILIVLGNDYPELSSGEKFLLEISDTLYYEPQGFTLLKLPLNKINNNKYILAAREMVQDTFSDEHLYFYNGFEDELSYFNYFGNGAKLCKKGDHTIFLDTINSPIIDKYTFSVWTRFDHLKYGIGWFTCEIKNKHGEVIYKETPDSRRSNDVHDNWIRTELTFPIEKDNSIKISFNCNRDLFIDELLIRPENQNVVLKNAKNSKILFNGYKIE